MKSCVMQLSIWVFSDNTVPVSTQVIALILLLFIFVNYLGVQIY